MIERLFKPKTQEEIVLSVEKLLKTDAMLLSDFLKGIKSKHVLKDFENIKNKICTNEDLYIIFSNSIFIKTLIKFYLGKRTFDISLTSKKYFVNCYCFIDGAFLLTTTTTPWKIMCVISKTTLMNDLTSL